MKITIYVQPGAKKTEFAGTFDGKIKLRISAPPVDGAANKAVTDYLAKILKIQKSAVHIIHGDKSRIKTVEIKIDDEKQALIIINSHVNNNS